MVRAFDKVELKQNIVKKLTFFSNLILNIVLLIFLLIILNVPIFYNIFITNFFSQA